MLRGPSGEYGKEDPCVSDDELVRLVETQGRPCPRVPLAWDNYTVATLAWYALWSQQSQLWPTAVDAWLGERSDFDRRRLMKRVVLALGDEGVMSMREAAVKRARRKAKEEESGD